MTLRGLLLVAATAMALASAAPASAVPLIMTSQIYQTGDQNPSGFGKSWEVGQYVVGYSSTKIYTWAKDNGTAPMWVNETGSGWSFSYVMPKGNLVAFQTCRGSTCAVGALEMATGDSLWRNTTVRGSGRAGFTQIVGGGSQMVTFTVNPPRIWLFDGADGSFNKLNVTSESARLLDSYQLMDNSWRVVYINSGNLYCYTLTATELQPTFDRRSVSTGTSEQAAFARSSGKLVFTHVGSGMLRKIDLTSGSYTSDSVASPVGAGMFLWTNSSVDVIVYPVGNKVYS